MNLKPFILVYCVWVTGIACGFTNQDDKILKVKEIEHTGVASFQEVSDLLESQTELHDIDLVNWDAFPYRPKTQFRIAHSNNQIWLKYYIQEKSVLAEVVDVNGAVSNDSCVEFFFDPLADGNYYNFEFNCIGTPLLAYGPTRSDRQFVDEHSIQEQIQVKSTLGTTSFKERTGEFTWEITLVIPAETLIHDEGLQLKGLHAKANFYKCGNKTAEAHYLSWNQVKTERPDFHRPEYFGTVVFE
ncbi:carbohydrate-binding family 9-like protein [uncultured Kriegella sp.]|uniref:carbohydrate-binding family 9-like protein n=1 Tax=uncultured Kriegella sp. TaxID=1798910 RepID=UPI0030DB70D5|tara:strand:- start:150122 stop:150850 length:729 start_codon:yes stop_codon:yes gene_type:complete